MSRSVIVTGAARGIGRAVVDLLSADGVNVVGVDREDAPRDLCNDSRSTWVAGDVTNPAVMRAAMSSATARGPLTGLVVSAALQSWWSVLELDETRWRDTLDVNLVAPALWARAVATTVRSSRGDTAGTSATGASAGPGAPRGPGAFGAAIVLISSVHAQVAGTGGGCLLSIQGWARGTRAVTRRRARTGRDTHQRRRAGVHRGRAQRGAARLRAGPRAARGREPARSRGASGGCRRGRPVPPRRPGTPRQRCGRARRRRPAGGTRTLRRLSPGQVRPRPGGPRTATPIRDASAAAPA